MKSNFQESKLVFFESGNADKFVPKIQAVEAKVQAENEKADPGKGKDKASVVPEEDVKTKIQSIEKRIKDSPVSPKYQDQIGKALTDLLNKREQDLKKVDVKKEEKLKAVFNNIVKDLEGFEQQPGVKEVYETIEPFFKLNEENKILPVINLTTYRRNSGHWEEINKKLEANGISQDYIKALQKLLHCKVDGKTGPETINAMSEMLGLGLNVKFDDKKTVYAGKTESIEEKAEKSGGAPDEDKAMTDGKTPVPINLPEKPETPISGKPGDEKPGDDKPAGPQNPDTPQKEGPKPPANLEGKGFYFDDSGVLKHKDYPGTLTILREPRSRFIDAGGIIHTTPDGIQRYLRPGGNPDSEWQPYKHHSIIEQSIIDNRKALGLPEKLVLSTENCVSFSEKYTNLKDKGFYQVGDKLLRKGNPGTYDLQEDGSVIFTWPNGGKSRLAPGADPDKPWETTDPKGKEAVQKLIFKKTLESKGFYYSEDGKLRRAGYNGSYEIGKNNELTYTWPNGGKSKLAGSLEDGKWQPQDPQASEALAQAMEEKNIEVNIGPGQYISLEKARESGFAKPSEISDAETMLNQFTQGQKAEMLKALTEGKELTDEQKNRLQQIGILKAALQTLRTDIKTSRTWSESLGQWVEFSGTTDARVHRINNMIMELDQAAAQIMTDPNKSIGQLISLEIKQILFDNKLNEHAPYLMDAKGRILEAKTFGELQGQYYGLVQFLRDKKDYASAQNLIEENLLGPQFAAKRAELAEAEKTKARSEARHKIMKMAASAQDEWTKQGLTEDQQDGYIKALTEEETKRNLNKIVAQMNNGLPFEKATGWDKDIMESYKDMMGTGEWYNLSDASWDTIIEEVIINAPLIILSGGAASLARAGLTAGARSLIAAARLTRFGAAAAKVAEGIEVSGTLGKAFYWGGSKMVSATGKVAGILAEGAAFETVYAGLHGENLFEGGWEKFPQWGKRILWSAASLGTFHVAGAMANKVNGVILKHITKFPDKSVGAAIQKLITTGSMETAAMLGIGAVQHYIENGDFKDWDGAHELFHALISVGALKIAGGGIQLGKKRFFPDKPTSPSGTDTSEPGKAPEAAKSLEAPASEGSPAKTETSSSKEPEASKPEDKPKEPEAPKPEEKAKVEEAPKTEEGAKESETPLSEEAAKSPEGSRFKDLLSSIKDLQIRKNITEFFNALFSKTLDFSAKSLKSINERWKTLQEKIKVPNIRKIIEGKIAEIKQKAEAKKIEAEFRRLKFENGDYISVKRSDGSVEKNWFVISEAPDGRINVGQISNSGRLTTKAIRKESLLKENPNGPHKKAADYAREQAEQKRQEEERARREQEARERQEREERERQEREERERRANEFKVGQEVLVERSNGDIEAGWKIEKIYPDGNYLVGQYINGRLVATKPVTYEDLKRAKEQGPRKARGSADSRNRPSSGPKGDTLFSEGKLKDVAELSKMTPKEISDLQHLAKDLDFAQKIFGLADGFSAADVKRVYRALSNKFHPDKHGGSEHASEMFKIIGEAKSTLDAYLEKYNRKAA